MLKSVVVLAVAVIAITFVATDAEAKCNGACQKTSVHCPANYIKGECPGPADIECCPEDVSKCNGQCQDNSLGCDGHYEAGKCPGPANVECCVPGGGGGCNGFADSQWNCGDVSCSYRVAAGEPQPNYECAEFVSRSLAAGGHIALSPHAPQSDYANFVHHGQQYDLLWTSSHSAGGGPKGVEDLLQVLGWHRNGPVGDCTVLFVVGSGGYETHVAVGVGRDTIDAHNMARYHVGPSFYDVNNVYNPPGRSRNATGS